MKDAVKLVATAVGILALIVLYGVYSNSRSDVPAAPIPNEHVAPPAPIASATPTANKSSSDDGQFEPLEDQMFDAYYQATETIRARLKDPADATFSSLGRNTEAKIVPYGYHQWLCAGWVDAFNSFGAKQRLQWGAYVFLSKQACRVDYFELGAETYGHLPQRIPFPVPPPTPAQLAAAKAKAATERKAAEARALQYDEQLADKGDAFGLLRMGERYRDGEGVTNNLVLAREYLGRAAKAGDPTAAEELKSLAENK